MPMRKILLGLLIIGGGYALYKGKQPVNKPSDSTDLFKDFSDSYRLELDDNMSVSGMAEEAYEWAGDRWDDFTGLVSDFWRGTLE